MSETRPHEVGEIELGGKTYPFTTPKIGPYLSALIRARQLKGSGEELKIKQGMIIGEAQAKWFSAGLGKEIWKEVQERLEDYDDTLDWEDLPKAFKEKMGDNAGRPTTSSSDSPPPSPTTTPSEEKPKQLESIFGD